LILIFIFSATVRVGLFVWRNFPDLLLRLHPVVNRVAVVAAFLFI
jgi:hypothetical protein